MSLPGADLRLKLGRVSEQQFSQVLNTAFEWAPPWVVEGEVERADGTTEHRYVHCDGASNALSWFVNGVEWRECPKHYESLVTCKRST